MDAFRRREKFDAIKDAEARGEVADSMEVRLRLVRMVEAGEITMAECQAELKRIKREAKRNGQTTRNKVFNRS